jgi:predicted dehydrogenase
VDGYGLTKLGTGTGWEVIYEQPAFDFRADPFSPIRMESYSLQDQEFVNSIVEGRSPEVTGEDGRAAVEIAVAVYRASELGQAIHLPLRGG